ARERADLGELRLELHRQRPLLELAPETQHRADGGKLSERGASEIHQIASMLAAAIGGREEWERDRTIGEQLEVVALDGDRFPFLHAAGNEAQRALVAQTQVVAARRPAADAHPEPAAHEAEVGGAARYGERQGFALEDRRLPAAVRRMPGADHLGDPGPDGRRLAGAAVEEQPVGPDERTLLLPRRLALAGEEVRHLARDLRLGRERQAPHAQPRAPGPPRPGPGRPRATRARPPR